MKRRAQIKSVYVIALLCGGSTISAVGRAHWEGFEAADPATPAAVLTFDSAVARYTALDAGPLPWRALCDGDSSTVGEQPGAEAGAKTYSGQAGTAPHTPATTE